MDNEISDNKNNLNVVKNKSCNKIRGVVKKTIIIIVIFYAILVIWRAFQLSDIDKTEAKVKEIHNIRLTMSDVDGSKLPPMPDEALNNSTVEGVDVNKNYVRDDVERWIFETYPDIRERAAWMQQAKVTQIQILGFKNSEEFKASLEEGSRSNLCLSNFYKTHENISAASSLIIKQEELDSLILNTEKRKETLEKSYSFDTSSGGISGYQCDVYNDI